MNKITQFLSDQIISARSFLPREFVTKASSVVTVSAMQHSAIPHKTHANIPIQNAGLLNVLKLRGQL